MISFSQLNHIINEDRKAASLAVFRILFGLMMCLSMIRFAYHGWIEKLYLEPFFHFKYYGFDWVVVPPAPWIYVLFFICGSSALLVALGWFYRGAIITFFLTFTYIELMDKTTYLNHYYFISILSFLLIFLPLGKHFSLDALRRSTDRVEYVPAWTIMSIQLLIAIVYFYAGLAKLNSDWMVDALPLSIWLPAKVHLPLIGPWLQYREVHYLFSWTGALYDLVIPFLLLWKPTRKWAFVAVVVFHVLTRILFPIGMFPFIMIFSALIFFDGNLHEKILRRLAAIWRYDYSQHLNGLRWYPSKRRQLITKYALTAFFVFQILFPFRYLLYPGHLFWTEQGYRFSWRVMLMEKTGYAEFTVKNGKTGEQFVVQNYDFLNSLQEKQMATQPDFIVEYGHLLGAHFTRDGHENVEVYVDSYVTLNGRKTQRFIDPNIDLMQIEDSFLHKTWILPFHE